MLARRSWKADHSGILTILDRWKTTVVDGPPIGWYLHHSGFLLPTSGLETPKLGNWRASIWRNSPRTREYVWANSSDLSRGHPKWFSEGNPPRPNPLSSGLGMIVLVICPDMWYILFKWGAHRDTFQVRWFSIVVVTSHHSHNTWDPEWCDSRSPLPRKRKVSSWIISRFWIWVDSTYPQVNEHSRVKFPPLSSVNAIKWLDFPVGLDASRSGSRKMLAAALQLVEVIPSWFVETKTWGDGGWGSGEAVFCLLSSLTLWGCNQFFFVILGSVFWLFFNFLILFDFWIGREGDHPQNPDTVSCTPRNLVELLKTSMTWWYARVVGFLNNYNSLKPFNWCINTKKRGG